MRNDPIDDSAVGEEILHRKQQQHELQEVQVRNKVHKLLR